MRDPVYSRTVTLLGVWFQARDLLQWSDGLSAEMQVETVVRDVAAVETLKARHQELNAEICARDDTFANVIQTGSEMVTENHFAAQDVSNGATTISFCPCTSMYVTHHYHRPVVGHVNQL